MRWKKGKRSSNIEDRRGQRASYSAASAPALLRFLPMLFKSKTGRTILIVGVVVFFGARLMGIDLLPLLLGGGGATTTASAPAEVSPEQQEMVDFVSAVLGDTEITWQREFQAMGSTYKEPVLVLYNGRVNSACGMGSAAMGPFYCPGDQKLYLDLSFFEELKRRHGAPGDFAQAYVIAHEVGHHVQTLLGISSEVQQAKRGRSKAEANALSVRQELQADCFAGLWGNRANRQRNMLDPDDLEEALRAASAIGDDRLQREATGRVAPDSFTHGTSAQRVQWFRTGFEQGDINVCNTFE